LTELLAELLSAHVGVDHAKFVLKLAEKVLKEVPAKVLATGARRLVDITDAHIEEVDNWMQALTVAGTANIPSLQ